MGLKDTRAAWVGAANIKKSKGWVELAGQPSLTADKTSETVPGMGIDTEDVNEGGGAKTVSLVSDWTLAPTATSMTS